jgi:hypothetical protein
MPTPASEILAKAILPTGLSSAELRDTVAPEIRRRSFFSARTAEAEYLEEARRVCAEAASGRIGSAKARELLARALRRWGYKDAYGAPGAIDDLGSEERLNLIIDTQRDMAHSVALIESQTDANLDAFPAWRLERMGRRRDPRNWAERWAQAAAAVNWEGVARNGEMVALKGSPIWEALGAGVQDYRDTLGNPYPPFAFNSGMDWTSVDRDECEALGLVPGEAKRGKRPDLGPLPADVKRALERLGPDYKQKLEEWAHFGEGVE